MQTLFDQDENTKMISRIQKLTPETKPLWGKMNVAQMLAHTQVALRVAMGDDKLKQSLFGKLFGRIAIKKLLSTKPFGKNMPTAPEFIMREQKDFNKEKSALLHLVERMLKEGPNGLTKEPHPFFGKMTPEQWDTLQYKHLDHHLSQFGV
jgi:hypothetical protein